MFMKWGIKTEKKKLGEKKKVAEMLHCGRPSAERWASQDWDPEEAAVFVDDGVQVLGRSGETMEIWRRIGMRAAGFPLSCVHVQRFDWPMEGITCFHIETKKQQFALISI